MKLDLQIGPKSSGMEAYSHGEPTHEHERVKRKDFFSEGIRELGSSFVRTPVGQFVDRRLLGLANLLAPQGLAQGPSTGPRALPRPPGASVDFDRLCTRCGDCIHACPYGTLFQVDPEKGPVLNPNAIACHLCEDWPCIAACETEALLPLGVDEVPAFGMAIASAEFCANTTQKSSGKGTSDSCSICQSVCPLPDVVSYKAGMPAFSEDCNGCGKCVAACPTQALEVVW